MPASVTGAESAVPIQPSVSGVTFFDETSGSKADPPETGLRCVLYISKSEILRRKQFRRS